MPKYTDCLTYPFFSGLFTKYKGSLVLLKIAKEETATARHILREEDLMAKVTQMREGASGSVTNLDEVREYRRIPWSGNLDEVELSRPGGLLLAALIRCANERRQQLNEMAKELGVTYGY